MLREELLHPAISHFPIALLVLVFFTKFAQLIVMKKYENLANQLEIISKFMLITGCIFILPTIYLGDMALEIVKKDISNITLAYQHDELANIALIIFVIAIVIDIVASIDKFLKHRLVLNILLVITLGIGNYYLVETAHLGAKLVYEEGAGVRKPIKL